MVKGMRLLLVILGCLLGVAGAAPEQVHAKRKRTAKAGTPEAKAFGLFQAARKDFVAKRFADAASKLEEAYKLFPQPMILFRRAEALENLQKIELAMKLYKSLSNTKDSKIRGPSRSGVRRLEALLAQPVEVSIISGEVVGALIFVDGKPFGTTPGLVRLKRGKHVLKVTKEGHQPHIVTNFVAEGIDTMKVEAILKPFVGLVRVKVPTGDFTDTRVLIDGRLVPIADAMATETAAISVPVGRHQLECARDGFPSYYRPFVVKTGEMMNLACAFGGPSSADESDGPNWAGWITLGAGIGMLAVGGGLVGSYFADLDLADRLGRELQSNKHIAGGILLGLGLVSTVTGAVILALDTGDDEPLPVDQVRFQMAPTFGPGHVGAALGGSF